MLVASRKTLMMNAAVANRRRALRMRARRPSHLMSGITATPVSKPERPSASRGKKQERNADDGEHAAVLLKRLRSSR